MCIMYFKHCCYSYILKNLPFEPSFDTKIQVKSKTKVASWFHAHLEIDLYIKFYPGTRK